MVTCGPNAVAGDYVENQNIRQLLCSNQPPEDPDIFSHRKKIISELAAVRDRIRALEDEVMVLKIQEKALAEHLEIYNTVCSPVRRIPVEIVQQIFLESVHDGNFGEELFTGTLIPALRISQVSAVWRDVAEGLPELWSRISLGTPDFVATGRSKQSRAHLLSLQIRLSKLCLLSVGIAAASSVDPGDLLIMTLLPSCPRWRELSAQMVLESFRCLAPVRALTPSLKRLSLSILDKTSVTISEEARQLSQIFEFSPQLTSVAGVGRCFVFINFAWDQLTAYHEWGTLIRGIDFGFLPRLSSVRFCTIHALTEDMLANIPSIIHLPLLEQLGLLIHDEATAPFLLNKLSCPKLSHLAFLVPNHVGSLSLHLSFPPTQLAAIRHVWFDDQYRGAWEKEDVLPVLQSTPMLTSLYLSSSMKSTDAQIFWETLHDTRFLSSLSAIYISHDWRHFAHGVNFNRVKEVRPNLEIHIGDSKVQANALRKTYRSLYGWRKLRRGW